MAKGNWSMGLIKIMNDPVNHIISSKYGVVIRDMYPKSKHHYLVLPKEDIPSIYHLEASHLDLLSELHLLAINVVEVMNCQTDDFKIGFHAQPSMQRLHLHVISKDFVSPCLKKKRHWNSFNTKLFLPYEEFIDKLRRHGRVEKMDKDELKEFELSNLRCNQCIQLFKTMPALKDHLLSHLGQ